MSKKILIPGWEMGQGSFGVTKAYLHWLDKFGTVIIGAPTHETFDDIDLVILPGGKDTSSSRYGEPPSYYNTDSDKFKEFFFDYNLPEYIKKGIPVFGICLGHQMLNIWGGGGLIQNVGHAMSDKSRDEKVHDMAFTDNFKHLKKELGYSNKIEVNSLHHQGFTVDELAEDFLSIAYGDFGIIEAMKHKKLPIASVQYHPEELYNDPLADYLVLDLISKSDNKSDKTAVITKEVMVL